MAVSQPETPANALTGPENLEQVNVRAIADQLRNMQPYLRFERLVGEGLIQLSTPVFTQ